MHAATTLLLDDHNLLVSVYKEDIYQYNEETDESILIGERDDYFGILIESKNVTNSNYVISVTLPYTRTSGDIKYATKTSSGSYILPSINIDDSNIYFDFKHIGPHNPNLMFDLNDKFYYVFTHNGQNFHLDEPTFKMSQFSIPEPSSYLLLSLASFFIIFRRNK